MAGKAELVRKLRDMRPVESLILLPDNPRHGDIGAISQSLERFGQQKPIVINRDGVILAGNHTFQAAKALGWDEIWVAESELEGADQPGFALADNRLSDLATYDHDILIRMLKDQPDLIGTGYEGDDIDELLREFQPVSHEDDMSGRPVGPAPPSVSQIGDRWTLGRHVLVCGDALEAKTYPTEQASLVVADPPYNVGVEYGEGTDDRRPDYKEWSEAWSKLTLEHSEKAIFTIGWANLGMAYQIWPIAHVAPWVKTNSMTPGPVTMWSVWEPLVFIGTGFKRQPYRTVDWFDFPMQHPGEVHAVPKPLNLLVELIRYYSDGLVLDPFAGSGTTMLAAEIVGVPSYNIEIEPGYCDQIVERWNKHYPDQLAAKA